MLVPDEVRKCVIFVYGRFQSGMHPCGTAFLFASPIPDTGHHWGDIVTARHVLEGIRRHSIDRKVLLRVNLQGGRSVLVETDLADWTFHPDDAVDVGISTFGLIPGADVLFLAESLTATAEVIDRLRIGVGDDVFITGLFVNHRGTQRNIPIVRVGNIAAVPLSSEPVMTAMGPMEAYLIEARSIGGLSGSPVFVYLDPLREGGGGPGRIFTSTGEGPISGKVFFLGLIHGHYDVSAAAAKDLSAPDGLKDEAINMGIAIVVPASKVLETIKLPEREEMREKRTGEIGRQQIPTPDAAVPPHTVKG